MSRMDWQAPVPGELEGHRGLSVVWKGLYHYQPQSAMGLAWILRTMLRGFSDGAVRRSLRRLAAMGHAVHSRRRLPTRNRGQAWKWSLGSLVTRHEP